jgi:hypothetical protein
MSPLRLSGSTSGFSQLDAPAIAGDQTFTLPSTGGTLDRLNRAGNILQVVSATKTDTFSTASTALVDVTGLSASITPSSTSNKILVIASVQASVSNADSNVAYFVLSGGNTSLYVGDSASNRVRTVSFLRRPGDGVTVSATLTTVSLLFLDAPSTTSSITYKVQTQCRGSGTSYVNRTGIDTDDNTWGRGASTITIMEVAA